MFEQLVDDHFNFVGEKLGQELVDLSGRILREQWLAQLALNRGKDGLDTGPGMIPGFPLVAMELELLVQVPPEPRAADLPAMAGRSPRYVPGPEG